MAATMTPHLVEQMLSALHGAEGEWGPSAEPLPVALRLESAEDLQAVAQTLEAWGAEVLRSEPQGPTLAARLPPGRLWDLLGLDGVLEVSESAASDVGAGPRLRWAALGTAAVAAGLFLWWLVGQGPLRPATVGREKAGAAAVTAEGVLPEKGVVEAALSGDSLKLASGRTVRLAGLKAPAYRHPERGDEIFSLEARAALSKLTEGEAVALTYTQKPRAADGSLLAFVSLADGTEVNALLLKRGAAQLDMETAGPRRRAAYSRLEAEARRARKGLWGGPVVGNLSSKVYHLPGGRFYQRVGPENRVLFETEEEARSAGYRPSAR